MERPSDGRSRGNSSGDNQGETPKERPEHTTFHSNLDGLALALMSRCHSWTLVDVLALLPDLGLYTYPGALSLPQLIYPSKCRADVFYFNDIKS